MVWTGGSQGTLAPCLVALFDQADTRWPLRSRASDGTIGDADHASRTSDHNPKSPNPPGWVDAADLTRDHLRGPDLDRLWDHLISKRDPRVKYVIWNGRIVKSYVDSAGRAAWVPQTYTGSNPHTKHIHISVTPAGRSDTSPWFPSDHQEDDMFTDDDRQELRNIRATGINTETAVINTEVRVTNVETRLAQITQLIGDIATGDLTAQQIKDAVAAVLREGVG